MHKLFLKDLPIYSKSYTYSVLIDTDAWFLCHTSHRLAACSWRKCLFLVSHLLGSGSQQMRT